MEEILREEIDALKTENDRLGEALIDNNKAVSESKDKYTCLEKEYDFMCKKADHLERLLQDRNEEIVKHRLDKECLRGKVGAYENIFAHHNVSLFAKD